MGLNINQVKEVWRYYQHLKEKRLKLQKQLDPDIKRWMEELNRRLDNG